MTQFGTVKDRPGSVDAKTEKPKLSEDEQPATQQKALGGLATAQGPDAKGGGALEFEPTTAENYSWWSADVRAAIKEHANCLALIATAEKRIQGLDLKPTDRESVAAALNDIKVKLTALLGGKVPVKTRPAAIALVTGAAAVIGAVDKQASDAAVTKADEDKQLLLAEEKKHKEAEQAKAAEEAKRKEEEAKQKKLEDEKRAKEAEQAKAAEQKKAEEKAAAEKAKEAEEQKKAEAAAAKKKAEEQAEQKRLAEEKAAAEKAKAEEDERLAREAEEQKKLAAEQAAQQRLAAYGDKTTAHGVAQKSAEGVATEEYKQQMQGPELAHGKALASLSKGQRKKGNQKYDQANATFDAAETQAKEQKEHRQGQIEDALVSVATSASGKTLSDADLAWVIGEAHGSSAFAQTLADLAAEGGTAFAKVIAKDARALAAKCLELLRGGIDSALVLRTARVLDQGSTAFGTWLRSLPGQQFEDALRFAEKFPTSLPLVAKVVAVLGTDADAEEFMTAMKTVKAKADDIDWLLGLAAQPDFNALIRVIRQYPINPAEVRPIHSAAAGRFNLKDIAVLCNNLRDRLAQIPAILPQADPHSTSFVKLWFDVDGDAAPPLLLLAVRAEALLNDAAKCPGFTITVEKVDKQYGRTNEYAAANIANDARTGFLFLNFPNHPRGKLHSHWNAQKKDVGKISSMHVKSNAGGTGLELNKWYQFFPNLIQAAIKAHNDEAGANAVTKKVKLIF